MTVGFWTGFFIGGAVFGVGGWVLLKRPQWFQDLIDKAIAKIKSTFEGL